MNGILRSFARYGWIVLLIIGLGWWQSAHPLSAAPSDEAPRLLYTSETGGFDINFPMPISLHEDARTITIGGQPLDCHDLGAKDYGAVWLMIYCDYPPEVASQLTAAAMLDAASEAARSFYGTGMATKQLSVEDITYDVRGVQFPGRAFEYAINARNLFDPTVGSYPDTYRARVYAADGRLYWIGAMVTQENLDNRLSLIDPFLDSFFIETMNS
jgi:hypothetical protein